MKTTAATKQRRPQLRAAVRRRAAAARLGQRAAICLALAISLLTLGLLQAGVTFDRSWSALLSATILGLVQAAAWPILAALAIHGHPSLSPLLAFGLSAAVLLALDRFVPGVDLAGFGGLVLAAFLLAVVHAVVSVVIALTDGAAYDRFAIRPAAAHGPSGPPVIREAETHGLLIVEINGLAEPVLREAIAAGQVPTIARWLGSGRYRLIGWECDLAAQPIAGQAGILHGDNFNVPAFRWYDKSTRTIVVSNHALNGAAQIERQVSNGHGLLAGGGAARGTLLSGDAADTLFTCSTVDRQGQEPGAQPALGLGRYGRARLAALFAREVAGEVGTSLGRALRQTHWPTREIGPHAMALAFSTAALGELCLHRVVRDMIEGTPSIYLAFTAYDAAAHRSGIRGRASLRALRRIDQQLDLIGRTHRYAARPYEVVVLSGHGQSQGPSLRHRYGQTLGQVVGDLVPDATVMVEQDHADEHVDTARTLLSGHAIKATRSGRWISDVVERGCDGDNAGRRAGPRVQRRAGARPEGARDILVLASGNLGLISFPSWPHRLTHEEISSSFPRLIPGLVRHDGIAFVLVTSARDGAMVIGAEGTIYLEEERIEGKDPLAEYGPHAARHLRRHSLFANCPDILVHGRYDRETDEVVSFEETVGSHGGLGGPQAQPFLLHPTSLRAGGPLIGARALYDLFTRWRQELASVDFPAAPRWERGG